MSWRPDDWDSCGIHLRYVKDVVPPVNDVQWDRGLIEAGADAIVDALKHVVGIHYSKEFHQMLAYPPQDKTGWLVFIPDED